MRCPECDVSGQKSSVFIGLRTTTLMSWQDFYDEKGNFHHHDPNTTSTAYSCSNGHRWREDSQHCCPTCEGKK